MILFFDTEFSDLRKDNRLISIGLVDESGERSFYAELDSTERVELGEFVVAVVLPQLEGGAARMSMDELRVGLGAWIADFEEPVTLATDSAAWDWPWIPYIFENHESWPKNLARRPLILRQEDEFNLAIEKAFANGLRRHHALDDAKANRLGWIATLPPLYPDASPHMPAREAREQTVLTARVSRTTAWLRADLSNGQCIEDVDIQELARKLVLAGVHVDHAHCADWREGEASPGGGTAIAFKVAMRRFAALLPEVSRPIAGKAE